MFYILNIFSILNCLTLYINNLLYVYFSTNFVCKS